MEAAEPKNEAAVTSRDHRNVLNILMTCSLGTGAGGVQVVFEDIVRWLERNGKFVHLLYDAPARQLRLLERTDESGRRTFACPMPASVAQGTLASLLASVAFAPITVFSLTPLLRRLRIDVVNCPCRGPSFIHLVMAARLTGTPVVVSVHGADIDSYDHVDWLSRWLLRSVLGGADRVVACSAALASQTAAVFPKAARKVSWAHNGLD